MLSVQCVTLWRWRRKYLWRRWPTLLRCALKWLLSYKPWRPHPFVWRNPWYIILMWAPCILTSSSPIDCRWDRHIWSVVAAYYECVYHKETVAPEIQCNGVQLYASQSDFMVVATTCSIVFQLPLVNHVFCRSVESFSLFSACFGIARNVIHFSVIIYILLKCSNNMLQTL